MDNIQLSITCIRTVVIIMGIQNIAVNAQEEQKEIVSNLDWGTLPIEIQKKITHYCDDYHEMVHACLATKVPQKKVVLNIGRGFSDKTMLENDGKHINYKTFDGYEFIDKSTELLGVATALIASKRDKNKHCDIFVSFEYGTIEKMYLMEDGLFDLRRIQKVHQDKVLDIALVGNDLVSIGEQDGFLRVWNNDDLNENDEKKFNFLEKIGAFPRSVNYLDKQKLVLVVSADQDYVYFNDELELVKHIEPHSILKSPIPNSILIDSLEQILAITKMEDQGIPFGTYMLLLRMLCAKKKTEEIEGMQLTKEKKRRLYIHPKEERFLAPIPLPAKRLKQYMRLESRVAKIGHGAKDLSKKLFKNILKKEKKRRHKKEEYKSLD